MNLDSSSKIFAQPSWMPEFMQGYPERILELEDRVKLVIELSRANVIHNTGGPFGAAIFEKISGKLIAVGVNQVIESHCSFAHAELMAFMGAQEALKTHDLGKNGLPDHELITSSQMCSMCFGAIPWSGVRRVVYAATARDVETLTDFDEGPLPGNWREELKGRGIELIEKVLQDEAREVLSLYKEKNGFTYNGRNSE